MSRQVQIERSMPIHTYNDLWHASNVVLEFGLNERKGSSWQFLSSIILTSFSVEAYTNHIGNALCEDWKKIERKMNPECKIHYLCDVIGVDRLNSSKRPLSTIKELFKFRNTIAHGRTEIIEENRTKNIELVSEDPFKDWLRADWQRKIENSNFALRVREDAEAVMRHIHIAVQNDKIGQLFTSGIGSNSATFI